MSKTVALVACVGKKLQKDLPARDLYIADWFRKASTYVEQIADEWYILSAKYGVISPDTVIAPYNQTLNKMRVSERRAWAYQVLNELEKRLKKGDLVVIFAGNRYREHLIEPLRRMGCYVEVPMEGLRIGQQLSWLKERLK